MKKNFIKLFAVLTVVLTTIACVKTPEQGKTGLTLKVKAEGEYILVKSNPATNLAEFDVTIEKSTGDFSKSWKYSELPSLIELSDGTYRIEVSSPTQDIVAWDNPVYFVEKDFVIVDGAVTALDLVCTLKNMKVTVQPTENFKKEVVDYSITVSYTEAGVDGTFLVWTAQDFNDVSVPAKEGYFPVKPLRVTVKGYRSIDKSVYAEVTHRIPEVSAADHHILRIDAQLTGQTNVLSLYIDSSVNEKNQDVFVPGFDEVVEGGVTPGTGIGDDTGSGETPTDTTPTLEWPAHPDFPVLDIVDGIDVNLIVKAPEKIAGFVVYVSENFQSMITVVTDNKPYIDLINDQVAIENLGSMLPAGDALLGKTEVNFPLSNLIPLIAQVGNKGEDYVFTLEVTDEKGQKLTKSLTFHLPL